MCCLVFFAVMLVLLHLGKLQNTKPELSELLLFDLLCLVSSVVVLLETCVIRVIADDAGIRSFDMLNRKRADVTYEELTSYSREVPGGWTLRAGESIVRIAKIDKHKFHAVIADKAPRALNAKLWKCGQLPPNEDFTALSLFDLNASLTNAVGAGVLSVIISIFSRGYALGYLISSLLQNSYFLKDILGKMDITSEGISARWPWEKSEILWTELTAVFCERTPDRFNYFVVTAHNRSITIPAHILTNPEVRRKFFYSIPDRTRCVNFDKFRFKRRGKGKKIFSEEPMGVLEPTMSA
jgi:hypothetical protein